MLGGRCGRDTVGHVKPVFLLQFLTLHSFRLFRNVADLDAALCAVACFPASARHFSESEALYSSGPVPRSFRDSPGRDERDSIGGNDRASENGLDSRSESNERREVSAI